MPFWTQSLAHLNLILLSKASFREVSKMVTESAIDCSYTSTSFFCPIPHSQQISKMISESKVAIVDTTFFYILPEKQVQQHMNCGTSAKSYSSGSV